MPPRTIEQLRNHYDVERELADRLRKSTRDERKQLYGTLYSELFARVPDHPRLTRRSDPQATLVQNQRKFAIVSEFVHPETEFGEFAPGDCNFCLYMLDYVKSATGFDISDQSEHGAERPARFNLIVYDGYNLDFPGASFDVMFSDQLIEHFHPDDVALHFEMAWRLLKPKGVYVCRVPHRLSGPHDISMYFSNTADGFHLNETTYTELINQMRAAKFNQVRCYLYARRTKIRLPRVFFTLSETILSLLPAALRRPIASKLMLCAVVAGIKE